MSALLAHKRPAGRRTANQPATVPALDWVIVAGLLVVYAALQAAFVRPPLLSDQLHYFLDASTLPAITEPAHQSLRIGLVIPAWVAIQIFGYSEAAYYAVPYLSAAGLVVVTYWLGRLLVDRLTGVAAALLTVINPFVLRDSSDLLPDIPATTLFTGAVVLMLWQRYRAGRRNKLRPGPPPGPHPPARWRSPAPRSLVPLRRVGTDQILLIAAGILLGWSYLVREFIVFWYPAVVIVGMFARYPIAWWRTVVVATVATISLEPLWGLVFHGNPLARVLAALNQPPTPPWRAALTSELIASGEIPDTPVDLLLALPRAMIASPAGWAMAALFVALVVAAVLVRELTLQVLAAWVVIPVVLLLAVILVTWSFDARILRPEKIRYWFPLFPPLIVGGSLGLRELGARVWGQASGRIMAQAVLVAGVMISVLLTGAELDRDPGYTRTGASYLLEFREWVRNNGETCEVLWADDDHWRASMRSLPMYLRGFWGRPVWDGEVRPLNEGSEFVELSALDEGALIRSRIFLTRWRREGRDLPAYLEEPPESWPLLLQTSQDHLRVFSVGPSTCARP